MKSCSYCQKNMDLFCLSSGFFLSYRETWIFPVRKVQGLSWFGVNEKNLFQNGKFLHLLRGSVTERREATVYQKHRTAKS